VIAAEDGENDDFDDDGLYEEDSDESYFSGEEEPELLTEEKKLELKLDQQNCNIELLVKGDGISFPLVGDIVRVKYVCFLTQNSQVVMNTKKIMQKPWVEFVLGVNYVIKGFDRALLHMSIGERSKLIFTPEYAYGEHGLPPLIPSNASLTFDLTLLGFRKRSHWVRPLMQDNTTQERPYLEDLKYVNTVLLANTFMDNNNNNNNNNVVGNDG